jgi:hypothetical protein
MAVRAPLGVLAALLLAAPASPAGAQVAPAYGYPLGDRTLRGVVVRFKPGTYDLGLLDERGNVDEVALHDGTIIFPIGLTLQPGMRVRIRGAAANGAFRANLIDAETRRADERGQRPAWYALWNGDVADPGAADGGNPPAPPAVNPPALP